VALCVSQCFEVIDGVLGPKLDPAGGITCGAAGLAISASSLDPISPDACNGLARRGNGLYAPCPDAISGGQGTGSPQQGDLPLVFAGASDDSYTFLSDVVSITNTTCCAVGGKISLRCGGAYLDCADDFYGSAHLEVNINGAGLGQCTPDTTMVFENRQGVNVHTAFNNMVDDNYLAIAAGATVTYQAAFVFFANTGSGTLSGTLGFEFVWVLPQIGCC
jgi:hypothetical protein